jgi:hypothetical protein
VLDSFGVSRIHAFPAHSFCLLKQPKFLVGQQ